MQKALKYSSDFSSVGYSQEFKKRATHGGKQQG